MSEQNPFGAPPPPASGYGQGGYGHPAPNYGQSGGFGQPPAYQQPGGYGQPPAYGPVPPQPQPATGWPAAGGYVPPAPPPKKSRKGLAITLAVVVVAIGVASAVLMSAVADKAAKEGTQKVVLPQSFQGLTKEDGNPLAQKLKDAFTSGQSDQNLDGEVATVYNKLLSDRAVVVYGGYGKISSPSAEETSFWSSFELAAVGKGGTTGPRTHPDPGPQGGRMSCEDLTTSTKETDAVCIWVDNSSLVAMQQTTLKSGPPTLDKAASDLRAFRAVAEVPK
ncbi:hypothetical protein E6W39_28125 [Kitasatospora acidiphila]|uniref:Uncharacterized protein n=1 Tax=Kitasatospora acidiphila TaxID=2567942 RepID=A0A540WAH2_9ACTN|nr:resistance to Congo red protein [Kitasatospora acidiphila]TQF05394.1 hypothetical protein E6W39_28125 [Kitasatospora acidiphila]